ncbi:MAG: biopolymer transporter ExbD [Verrucomicrobiae bacterium]|nr:biopolymer transporter ExbD [Verrucomicrobiae bacterium]
MKIDLQDNEHPEVSMSPLIDCVFLLLIFFLVASMTKVKDKDISVDLPKSEAAIKLRPHNDQVVIGITTDSEIYWEGAPCTTNFLLEQLRDLCVTDPERQIRIDMDQDAPFGRFVEVMDACQFYGLGNVGIRTYDESYNRN